VSACVSNTVPPWEDLATVGHAFMGRQRLPRSRASLWGGVLWVRPVYLQERLGDGRQLIWLEPILTRPDFYVLWIDSGWSMRNSDENPFCDHLHEVQAIIDEEWGSFRQRPSPDLSDGSAWGKASVKVFGSELARKRQVAKWQRTNAGGDR
jgi:hypothetical protein